MTSEQLRRVMEEDDTVRAEAGGIAITEHHRIAFEKLTGTVRFEVDE